MLDSVRGYYTIARFVERCCRKEHARSNECDSETGTMDEGSKRINGKRFVAASIAMGWIWGGIGMLLGYSAIGLCVLGGFVASPFIGFAVGRGSASMYERSLWAMLPWSVITLYLAAACFGAAVGLCDLLAMIPNRIWMAVVLQSVNGTLFGTTLFLPIVWPLAWISHFALRSFYRK